MFQILTSLLTLLLQCCAVFLCMPYTVAVLRWGPGGHRPLQMVARPPYLTDPKIVARPPNLAVLVTHCGQLILSKISKHDDTRCQILRLKCTKFDLRLGFAQILLGEITALFQTP